MRRGRRQVPSLACITAGGRGGGRFTTSACLRQTRYCVLRRRLPFPCAGAINKNESTLVSGFCLVARPSLDNLLTLFIPSRSCHRRTGYERTTACFTSKLVTSNTWVAQHWDTLHAVTQLHSIPVPLASSISNRSHGSSDVTTAEAHSTAASTATPLLSIPERSVARRYCSTSC